MRYSIHQTSPTSWELRVGEQVVATFSDAAGRTGYDLACSALSGLIGADLAAVEPAPMGDGAAVGDGLLPEIWTSPAGGGIAFQERLPMGRDFTECKWSWRDPAAVTVPLMLMTETSMGGHLGAELAGFVEAFSDSGGTVSAHGRFYDSECGIEARALLLDGRAFGVSVDPTENIMWEDRCTETDEDGWCMAMDTVFLAYEIGAVTMCPIAGFEGASIVLGDSAVAAAARPVVADAVVPNDPPAAWFALAEPLLGHEFLPGIQGDVVLTDQGDGSLACPLTITDDGLVYGHLARWGQCHVGYQGECVSPPTSLSAYANFHVGTVRTAEGDTVATGALIVGCDHAPLAASLWEAHDHYAHSGSGWADVRASNGELGVWISGALRPGVTDEQLRVLRALSLSGDWRDVGGHLELAAGLAVNTPGFPIAREALAASALAPSDTTLSQRFGQGRALALVAAGRVTRCPECAERARLAARSRQPDGTMGEVLAELRALRAANAMLDLRTRHLLPAAAEAARARVAN